ncbi:MAG: AMP-binding protein [Thermodesulfobacteriota bacterium]
MIHDTIGKLIQNAAYLRSRQEALVHMEVGVRYTYMLFGWEVERFARGLIQCGLEKGDRVALWAANIPEWLISFLGIISAGGVAVPINPDSNEEDLRYILEQSGSKIFIFEGDQEDRASAIDLFSLKGSIPSLERLISTSRRLHPEILSWRQLMELGRKIEGNQLTQRADAIRPEDPVSLMYTSGTTGRPKGVILDHLGLINKSLVSAKRQGITAEDRLCLFFPLFHMFGNTCIALSGLLQGAALILPGTRFDPETILKAVVKEKCTAVFGSPSMIISLVDHLEFDKKDWRTVKKGIIGGAPCPIELMRRLVEEIGVSDITVAYGITETSSWVTMTRPSDPIELRVSTIGTPLECNEVMIADLSTGKPLPPGKQGELCTRGFLMKGYYNRPAATAKAIDAEGWFHTGDLGMMDENGYVRITGRLKDVIVRDGMEIYPVEIEEVLYRMPEISEVQVFGFPDSGKGQEVAAWIKLKEGASLSLDAVAAHMRENMDVERLPRYYKFVSGFPMTGSGKIQKFRLAEMAAMEYAL